MSRRLILCLCLLVILSSCRREAYQVAQTQESTINWENIAEIGATDAQESEGILKSIHLPITQVLTLPEFAKDKPLGRFLRNNELSMVLQNYPFVESMYVREREYLVTKDKTEIGYDIEITLHKNANNDSGCYRSRYEVWEQGEQCMLISGHVW